MFYIVTQQTVSQECLLSSQEIKSAVKGQLQNFSINLHRDVNCHNSILRKTVNGTLG